MRRPPAARTFVCVCSCRSGVSQAFADRVAAVFAPGVCLIAAFTFVFWMAMIDGRWAPPSWFVKDGADTSMSMG